MERHLKTFPELLLLLPEKLSSLTEQGRQSNLSLGPQSGINKKNRGMNGTGGSEDIVSPVNQRGADPSDGKVKRQLDTFLSRKTWIIF